MRRFIHTASGHRAFMPPRVVFRLQPYGNPRANPCAWRHEPYRRCAPGDMGARLACAVFRGAGRGNRQAAVLPVDSRRRHGWRGAQSRRRSRAGFVAAGGAGDSVCAALAWICCARPVALGIWVGLAALCAGFLSMGLRTARVDTPVLDHVRTVQVAGLRRGGRHPRESAPASSSTLSIPADCRRGSHRTACA